MKRLLSYTQNQDKTEHQLYVSGFHCDPDTACQSMEETKRVWFMPTDKGILAYHIIQSFSPGEATPEQVHQIGCEFARRFLADRFECTVSTHLDKGHLHNHIVTNSVCGSACTGGRTGARSCRNHSAAVRTNTEPCRIALVPKYSEISAGGACHLSIGCLLLQARSG